MRYEATQKDVKGDSTWIKVADSIFNVPTSTHTVVVVHAEDIT